MAATISRLTLPTSTMRTMSTVSASVTRRPSTELGLLAEPAHQLADLRAAAVHDDRVHADGRMQHDVLGEQVGRASGSSMALPPYLITTVVPENSLDVRQRLDAGSPPGRRRRPRRRRVTARQRSRRAHVLVDVGVGQVGGEHPAPAPSPTPRSQWISRSSPGHVRGHRGGVVVDGDAVAARPRCRRRRWSTRSGSKRDARACRARWRRGPSTGPRRTSEHLHELALGDLAGGPAGLVVGRARRSPAPARPWWRPRRRRPSARRGRRTPRPRAAAKPSAGRPAPARPLARSEHGVVGGRAAVDGQGVEAVGHRRPQHRVRARRARPRRRW